MRQCNIVAGKQEEGDCLAMPARLDHFALENLSKRK